MADAPTISAISSGLTSTLPCPIASAAFSVPVAVAGIEPEKASTGRFHFAPRPERWAALYMVPSGSASATLIAVVLQE